MKARISRKFFCLLLAVVMVCTLLPITALAAEPSGRINGAVITQNAVSVELKDVTFTESVAVELYSGGTLLTRATLKTGILPAGQNHPFVTCCIPTKGEDAAWSLTPWTPKDDVVPNKAVLFVDGSKKDEKDLKLNADEWAALPGTAFPSSGSINGAVITQNAVSVELKDVTFTESVAVELYSGNTPLTTATLKPGILPAGQNHLFVTCCIPTKGEDAAWSLTPWTPKDDVVPDKAVLFVDGSKKDEKPLKLNADEWANLPGTAFPSSGSINGAVITQSAVSVELENVNFESSVEVELYSGNTPLTTATLKPGILPAGQNHLFVTCCIPTKGEDAAWSLTPWTPKDDVVPDKAVLFVDGSKKDEKPLKLNADEWANLPGTAFPSSGSINGAVITQSAVSVELENVNFESSVEVELYSGNTPLTTATLKPGILPAGQNHLFVTCCIPTKGEDAAWSLTPWTPKDDVVPDKAVLFVDGNKKDEKPLKLNADEWAALPGTAFPSSGSINGAVITQSAVSVELENVNFESSVEVELYSGNTPLTTATLKPGILPAGQNHLFVTCCIPTKGEDAAWSLTPWTPKDDVVPDKAVLFVDGNKKDEKPLKLNADEWANLPGTAFPSSGSINGAVITQSAVSVELENVNFESSVEVELYSGNTPLTTATLKPGILPAGQNHLFVTCCIPTKGEDAAWSLTPWTPKDDVVPDKAVLFVDGNKKDEKPLKLNADEWAALPGTAFPYSGSIERAGITHDNGVLKNAVSVDLKNVNFESSVQVQLYSGETLLTTATLRGVNPGSHAFLTCCIATETADEYWALTPWTPKDDVVPNKVVLFVDGNKMEEKTFTLNADEWAALPGTAFPYRGYIRPQYPNPTPVQPVLPVILPPQTGDMPLWYAIARFLGLVK